MRPIRLRLKPQQTPPSFMCRCGRRFTSAQRRDDHKTECEVFIDNLPRTPCSTCGVFFSGSYFAHLQTLMHRNHRAADHQAVVTCKQPVGEDFKPPASEDLELQDGELAAGTSEPASGSEPRRKKVCQRMYTTNNQQKTKKVTQVYSCAAFQE